MPSGGPSDLAVDRARAVAELHAVHAFARPAEQCVAHPDAAARQLLAAANHDPVGARVRPQDVQRVAAADPDPAALTDREVVEAAMRAHNPPLVVNDLAWPLIETAMAAQERVLSLAGQEAQVLAFDLGGHREIGRRGKLAHARLGEVG